MTHAIEFTGVDKWFDRLHALVDVSLEVEAGEVIVVCGPSGSGKSTLIRCVNRLEPIQKGDIRVDGVSIPGPSVNLARLRADVGMVFQSFNLFPHMTALENIMLAPLKVKGVPRMEAEKTARGLLARVRIPDRADSYPANLSGDSSSGWPSRERSPCSPRSCSSTNQPRPSIPGPAPGPGRRLHQ